MVLVPGTHPLAGKDSVVLADLRDDPLPLWPSVLEPAADGGGPVVRATGELTQFVALGRVLAVVPESIRDRVPRDVACLPVTDAPATTLVIAWAKDSRSPHVAEFVRVAAEVAAR